MKWPPENIPGAGPAFAVQRFRRPSEPYKACMVGARAHGGSSAMDSRRLAVLLVSALVACARAHPGVGNDIDDPTKPLNEIGSKEVVKQKPDDAAGGAQVSEANPSPGPSIDSVTLVPEDTTTVVEAEEKADLQDASNETVRAVNEQYPHAVLFGGTCGGTIISSSWILTAGHCTLFTGGRYVVAGTGNTRDDSGVRHRVKRLLIHPLFSVGPYWLNADRFNIKQVAARWDFLLAELEDPLPLDGKTMVAATINDQSTVPEGLEVGYGGYGAEHHGETMRGEMHGMELQVLADEKCKEALVQYDSQDMMCTKGRPPRFDSACNGDSGSGLVANGTVYGVASWVQEDSHRCFNGALVVFSRVSAVREWIKQVTKI